MKRRMCWRGMALARILRALSSDRRENDWWQIDDEGDHTDVRTRVFDETMLGFGWVSSRSEVRDSIRKNDVPKPVNGNKNYIFDVSCCCLHGRLRDQRSLIPDHRFTNSEIKNQWSKTRRTIRAYRIKNYIFGSRVQKSTITDQRSKINSLPSQTSATRALRNTRTLWMWARRPISTSALPSSRARERAHSGLASSVVLWSLIFGLYSKKILTR